MRGAQIRMSEYFTASGGGTVTEGEFGTNTITPVTFNFWGNVDDEKSDRVLDNGKRYDEVKLTVIARADDVQNLTIDHTITMEGDDRTYVVTDIHGSDLKDRGISSSFKSYHWNFSYEFIFCISSLCPLS